MLTRFAGPLCVLAVCGTALGQNVLDPAPAKPLPTGNAAIDTYNVEHLKLTRSLMSPQNVADTFGRRIGKRYIALQLTVANRNSEYQWLITDGAADLTRLIRHMRKDPKCESRGESLLALLSERPNPTVSGSDLAVLRGVAEKGQILDPRNLTIRLLQGSGTIAAGLLGVTTFGSSFAPSVAAFNGPLVSAFQRMFPDQTVNQLNRLNDSAYAANAIVLKQQARVLVVFIPVELLLNKQEQASFYKDPNSVYSSCVDLRLLDAFINGHFIAQVNVDPVITSVAITAAEAAKFGSDNFKVAGVITGRFLDSTSLALTGAPEGVTITATEGGSGERVPFELSSVRPLQPNATITIQVRNAGGGTTLHTLAAQYSPAKPTIAAGGVAPASLKQGEQKTVEISGTGFLPDSRVELSNATGLTIGDVEYVSTGKLKVDIAVADSAVIGARELVVRTSGGTSGKAVLTLAAK